MTAGVFTPIDEFGFHHRLAATPGPALVLFTGEGCSSCRAWKQLLGQHQASHPELKLYEVDAGRSLALAREFGVFHLPAMFLYRDGHYHCPLQCEAKPDVLESAIAAALSAPPHEAP